MEDLPQLVPLHGIVPGDGAHVGEFVPQRHNLGIVRGSGEAADGSLLAGTPAVLFALAFRHYVTFGRNQSGDTVPEFGPDLIHGHVRVLHGVVQGSSGQQFLVGGDGGHNLHGFHGVDNIRKALATAFSAGMGFYREDDSAVQ